MEKVAPSERFRSELDEVLAGVGEEQDPIETVGRLGARLILQQVLEDEVTEFLGRRRYERAEETVSHGAGKPGAILLRLQQANERVVDRFGLLAQMSPHSGRGENRHRVPLERHRPPHGGEEYSPRHQGSHREAREG